MTDYKSLIDKLYTHGDLDDDGLLALISGIPHDSEAYIFEKAGLRQHEVYGNKIFIRGLIEISNICKNDCYYCGIRKSNQSASRYRLTKEDILQSVDTGYSLGFRTFVMQGGEDAHFSDDVLADIISSIKASHPDCAVTLSLGERSYDSYKALKAAGADRYLLRHETALDAHYSSLHPASMSLQNRKECLYNLKKLGYQTGSGIMVGSPYQTPENILADLRFLQDLQPEMIGIGPFIPHKETPFRGEAPGNVKETVLLLGILRLLFPHSLIPATTALATLDPENGRTRGILAGANVIMPNLSPQSVRAKYSLYDKKLSTGTEAAEGLALLRQDMAKIGYEIVTDRGDFR